MEMLPVACLIQNLEGEKKPYTVPEFQAEYIVFRNVTKAYDITHEDLFTVLNSYPKLARTYYDPATQKKKGRAIQRNDLGYFLFFEPKELQNHLSCLKI